MATDSSRAALENEYRILVGQQVAPDQADRLEEVARQLGRPLVWSHIDVNDHRDQPERPGRVEREKS